MFGWLETNEETIALAETCKRWWAIANSYGYIRKLKMTPHTDGNKYISLYNANVRTINSVYVENQPNPHDWIFVFPRMVNCSECELAKQFIPNGGKPCKTELLVFRNLHTKTASTTFKTNWALFPKLRRLVLYVEECDLTGLENLKHLDTTYIRTSAGVYTRNGITGVFAFAQHRIAIAIGQPHEGDVAIGVNAGDNAGDIAFGLEVDLGL